MSRKSLVSARESAFIRQGGLCCYCDEPMWLIGHEEFADRHGLTLRQAKSHQCTAEHLHARCDGGGNRLRNIAAACALCNHRRHAHRAGNAAPDPQTYRSMVLGSIRRGKWRPWPLLGEESAQKYSCFPQARPRPRGHG